LELGRRFVIQACAKITEPKIEQSLQGSERDFEVPIPILANFVAGSFLTLLKWWLENKMIYSPEKIDENFNKLTLSGIEMASIN
jgi:hypothetical protein